MPYPKKFKYQKGFKYQCYEDYTVFVDIYPKQHIETDFLILTVDGYLTIKKGYASDGPSGPTFDTEDSIRGAFVHDALYQLMRLGLLPQSCRKQADRMLRILCEEDGMNPLRAELWEEGVNHFAAYAAKYGTEREVLTSP